MSTVFERQWFRHKAVLQRGRGLRQMRPMRIKTRPFLDKVYVFGVEATKDWSCLDGFFDWGSGKASMAARGTPSLFKKDFAKTMIHQGEMYTVRDLDTPDAEPVALALADDAAVPRDESPIMCFEVLDTNPQGKTFAVKVDTSSMYFPILTQRWDVVQQVTRADSSVPSSVTVLK